jgi:S1-C subfamily serine protease
MQDYSGYGEPPRGDYGPTMPMPPMPPRPPRRRVGALSYLLVALAAGALGAGTVVALYHPASNSAAASPQPSNSALNPAPLPSTAVPQPGTASPGTSAGEQAIVNKVEPGLVIINTTLQYNSESAAATGMVLNSDGLVLTNNHVIEDSTSITAITASGKHYTAKVLGYDTTGDVALIQLQGASGLRTVPLGDSGALKTGDSVVAMGNAEGQNAIVPATGQVTALNQTITAGDQGGSITSETLHDMIQTNANIVSGDSGGPLANSAGQVIGMDTAGNGGGFSVQGQGSTGYAIPIDNALAVARQIAQRQASSTVNIGYPPFMGIFIGQGSNSNPQAQAEAAGGGYQNPFGGFGGSGNGSGNGNGNGNGSGSGSGSQTCYSSNRGVGAPQNIANVNSGTLILGTICGGPAAAAGLTAGSVITAVNGQAVGSPGSLTSVVSKYHPGDTISVTWVSPSGQRSTSSIKLTAGPPL